MKEEVNFSNERNVSVNALHFVEEVYVDDFMVVLSETHLVECFF